VACPLIQGVQIISSYTVVVGTFSFLSLLMRGPHDEVGETEAMVVVEFAQTIMHTTALFAGLKGILGVLFRDPARLRVLFLYHLCELVLSCVAIVFREVEACDELKKLQQLHKSDAMGKLDCSSARIWMFAMFSTHVLLVAYFAYVIWSLFTRLEAGDMAVRPHLFEEELANRAGLADPWLLIRHGDNSNLPFPPRVPPNRQHGAALGGAGAAEPAPFSGQPRTLAEQQPLASAPEHFRGTPHRLE